MFLTLSIFYVCWCVPYAWQKCELSWYVFCFLSPVREKKNKKQTGDESLCWNIVHILTEIKVGLFSQIVQCQSKTEDNFHHVEIWDRGILFCICSILCSWPEPAWHQVKRWFWEDRAFPGWAQADLKDRFYLFLDLIFAVACHFPFLCYSLQILAPLSKTVLS